MQKSSILSNQLIQAILNTKNRNEQTMIFINRRGYSRTLKCKKCGYEAKCENCNNLLSYHRLQNELICHYCGYKIGSVNICKQCNSKELVPNKGAGVEQLQKEIIDISINNKLDLKTILFSSDEISKEDDIARIVKEINDGDIDVIIGTQIMSKGYNFPRLTTIIILDIDKMCLDGDFRIYEKMFHLLFQLSGRAGRMKDGAKVYIQTLNQKNPIIQNIKNHDIENFYKQELKQRKEYNLPPFIRFIAVIISSKDNQVAINVADKVKNILDENLLKIKGVSILGPSESQLNYINKYYRYRILIKSPKNNKVIEILNNIFYQFNISKKAIVKIDVDPYSFL